MTSDLTNKSLIAPIPQSERTYYKGFVDSVSLQFHKGNTLKVLEQIINQKERVMDEFNLHEPLKSIKYMGKLKK